MIFTKSYQLRLHHTSLASIRIFMSDFINLMIHMAIQSNVKIGMVDGRLCWRNDLEHYSCTFSGGSWVDIINDIKKVYIKDLGESEWRAIDWINDEDDIDCAVCYKNWNVNMVLPCGHKFCKQCILQWAKVQNTCPCCRREFVVKFNTML